MKTVMPSTSPIAARTAILAVQETGEFGWEDFVNPGNVAGLPDNMLNVGEDVNSNNILDLYGATPVVPAGAVAPLNAAATPLHGRHR